MDLGKLALRAVGWFNSWNQWVFKDSDVMRVVQIAAGGNRKMRMTYTKITTGETKDYVVAPYSFRTKITRRGVRRMLYAYDFDEGTIKSFVVTNISDAELLPREDFAPKWEVEIAAVGRRKKVLDSTARRRFVHVMEDYMGRTKKEFFGMLDAVVEKSCPEAGADDGFDGLCERLDEMLKDAPYHGRGIREGAPGSYTYRYPSREGSREPKPESFSLAAYADDLYHHHADGRINDRDAFQALREIHRHIPKVSSDPHTVHGWHDAKVTLGWAEDALKRGNEAGFKDKVQSAAQELRSLAEGAERRKREASMGFAQKCLEDFNGVVDKQNHRLIDRVETGDPKYPIVYVWLREGETEAHAYSHAAKKLLDYAAKHNLPIIRHRMEVIGLRMQRKAEDLADAGGGKSRPKEDGDGEGETTGGKEE